MTAVLMVPVGSYAKWLRALFGPVPPREKSCEEARWEDDGGTLGGADVEGYSHALRIAYAPD